MSGFQKVPAQRLGCSRDGVQVEALLRVGTLQRFYVVDITLTICLT